MLNKHFLYLYVKNKSIITSFTHHTDQELLAFIQQGNEMAFTVLYKRYYLPLCKKAFQRIPSTPQVEEIVQDVFVNLWSKALTLDTKGNVRAYLYATLRNKILHELRTESTRSFYMEKLKKLSSIHEGEECLNAIYAREREAQIIQIVTDLSPQCREAFRLSRFENLSYKEIAERMQLSVNTVEKHVAKALRILRSKLNEYGDVRFALFLLFAFCC